VEVIVREQISKVLDLLRCSTGKDWPAKVRIGTACSGTESPVLAMRLDQEALRQADGPSSQLLQVDHVMSCEIEPFKQAYISRNFPDTRLFPDIRQLVPKSDTNETENVCGALVPVPTCDLFVAGTVCKDFSMRRTKFRLDLEDQGKSGQTFFAACEYIFKHQPKMTIFENVYTAPWEKMCEYITGVVPLKSALASGIGSSGCKGSVKTNIKTNVDTSAEQQLTFEYTNKCELVVVAVPKAVGVRLGAKLEAVRLPSRNSSSSRAKPVPVDKPLKNMLPKHLCGKELTIEEVHKMLCKSLRLQGDELLIFDTAAQGFFAKVAKVDSKRYGLPQTRKRGYMFVWHKSFGGEENGDPWAEIVVGLESAVKHGLPSYLLPDDDERVRRFREVLRGPLGRRAAQENAEAWGGDWWTSPSKDALRAREYRTTNGILPETRSITGWGPEGRRLGQPPLWPEMLRAFDSRQCDLIEAFSAECSAEEPPRDPLHSNYVWDISQNVGMASPYSQPGVCGCITPGGWLLLPDKGRCVLGYEKLILQGIPANRVVLGMESEVQLSDLAGNAMSLPVVNACILAALVVKEFARRRAANAEYKLTAAPAVPHVDPAALASPKAALGSALRMLHGLAEMCGRAEASSVLCLCESSGSVSSAEVLCCSGCGLSLCRNCVPLTATESHDLCVRPLGENRPRNCCDFGRELRSATPQRLRLSSNASALTSMASCALSDFVLSDVKRGMGAWMLRYLAAREDGICAGAAAELRIYVGHLARGIGSKGLRCELRTFSAEERGTARVQARCFIREEGGTATWELRDEGVDVVELMMKGACSQASYRAEMGLSGFKDERWPGEISVTTASRGMLTNPIANSFCGDYFRTKCRGTAVRGAIWCRRQSPNASIGQQPQSYLYFRPDVDRTLPDVPVFATAPSYHDGSSYEFAELEQLVGDGQQQWAPEEIIAKPCTVKANVSKWRKCPSFGFECVPDAVSAVWPKVDDAFEVGDTRVSTTSVELVRIHGIECLTTRCREIFADALTAPSKISKAAARGNMERDQWKNMTNSSRAMRHFADASAATLLREGIPSNLQSWQRLPACIEWGTCPECVPRRPKEVWDTQGTRRYDPAESVSFEDQLRNRPNVWDLRVRRDERCPNVLDARLGIRPMAAAHRAAAALRSTGSSSSCDSVRCDWRVVEPTQDLEGVPAAFRVPNSDPYGEAATPKAFLMQAEKLYPRQRRALQRMLDIEAGVVEFEQEERSEHALPGIGWLLEARAASRIKLPGGVLADEMGGGKTVTTLALIASTTRQTAAPCPAQASIGQSSGATLVLAPPCLIQQWDSERERFTGNALRTVLLGSAEAVLQSTVSDLINADIVIASSELLADERYLQNFRKKSEFKELPPFPSQAGHREPEQITGIWVPGHPASPYGTAKGKQQHREQAAFFSVKYDAAIGQLRQRKLPLGTKAPPLEYFLWDRVVVDEVHYAFVTQHKANAAQLAARELLGVAQADVARRPLRARRGIWGLTGTPMLNDDQRVTEMAALCGGVYVMSASRHWRNMERASVRDQYLLAQEPALSTQYRTQSREQAQKFVTTAVQRNRCDKFDRKKLMQREENARLNTKEFADYRRCLTGISGLSPSPQEVPCVVWQRLLNESVKSPARARALQDVVNSVHLRWGPLTKVVVFAEAGEAQAAARAALAECSIAFTELPQDAEHQGGIVKTFAHVDATDADRARPRVLLLTFEQAVGLNLQHSCHHAVLFAPLWGEDQVLACAQEQQAIGRIHRPGQKNDVHVYRLVVVGPKGEELVDQQVVRRNTSETLIAAATSNC
jgi:site-specific DNA-cytosine methylase/superfamily II DNA or RNA helicase